MAAHILSVVCCLLALIQISAGSLVLGVNPTEVYPGVTQTLTVSCTFSPDGVSSIVGPISLIIAKENQQDQFDDLLSVNIYSPDEPTKTDLLRSGIVTGHISGDDQSFLTIQWSSPTASESGLYRCEINGVDSTGHPTETSQTMMVTSHKPDVDQLTSKVNDLQHQLDNRSQTIDALISLTQIQTDVISTLSDTVSKYTDTIANMEKLLRSQYMLLAKETFNVSSKYQGHYYLLSKEEWTDSKVSEQTCEDYGGYLVEINSSDEQEFVEQFLDTQDGFQGVLVSGAREKGHQVEVWTYFYSGSGLTYTNWIPGEPNYLPSEPSYHGPNFCIYMPRVENWQWVYIPCIHGGNSDRFMCEVNIN